MNTYGYVRANPLRYIDPTGEVALLGVPAWVWASGGATAAVGWSTSNAWQNSSRWDDVLRPWPNPHENKDLICEVRQPSYQEPPFDPNDCGDVYTKARDTCSSKGINRFTCNAVGAAAWAMCVGGFGGGDNPPGTGSGLPPGWYSR